jgi:hypothetical protein
MPIILVSSPTTPTYATLQTNIASWLHRDDLADEIVDFITLAEIELNSDLRNRLMEVDHTLTLTSGTRTITIPSGYIEPILLELVISGEDNDALTYVQPQQLNVNSSSGASSRPRYWTVNGENIEFPNLSDQTYSVRFRMLQEYDIATTITNSLLTKYQNLYLYASLIHAAIFIRDFDLEQTARRNYEILKQKIIRKEGRSKVLTNLRIEMPSMSSYNNILTG